MIRSWIRAAALFLIAVTGFSVTVCRAETRVPAAYEAIIRSMQADMKVPGLSVAIVKGDEVIVEAAYGTASIEYGIPATVDTVFRTASATKFISSLLFLSFVQSGELKLDAPLGTYLPNAPADRKSIPVWRFLNHTSGIPDVFGHSEFEKLSNIERERLTSADIVKITDQYPLDYPAGERWRYQQSGFATIVSILETRTKKSYAAIVRDRLLVPLGAPAIAYGDSSVIVKGRNSQDYVWRDGALHNNSYFYPPALHSGAGANISARDMVRFFRGLNRGDVIKPETLRIAYDPAYVTATEGDDKYGIGVAVREVDGHVAIGHSGGNGFANIAYFPEQKIGIAVFSNLPTSEIGLRLTEVLARKILQK